MSNAGVRCAKRQWEMRLRFNILAQVGAIYNYHQNLQYQILNSMKTVLIVHKQVLDLMVPDCHYHHYRHLIHPEILAMCKDIYVQGLIFVNRSAEGPAGRVCGHKAGYATLTR